MKKLISLVLAFTMILSLAACGQDNNVDDPNKNNPDSNVIDNQEDLDNELPPVEDDDNSEDIVDEPEDTTIATVGSLNERLAYIIDNSRTDQSAVEAFPSSISNRDGVLDLLAIGEENVSEFSVAFSMMSVHAYMVAVIKPVEGKEELVKQALETYKESTIKSFEQYLPDQLEIAQNAIVFDEYGYIGLVMCGEQDEVKKNIVSYLEHIEDIAIDESLAKSDLIPMELYTAVGINETFIEAGQLVFGWDYFKTFEHTEEEAGKCEWIIPIGTEYEIRLSGESFEEDPTAVLFGKVGDDIENYVDMITVSIETEFELEVE